MQWQDEALILGGRRYGENGLILDVLTASRGRRSGLVYGGASRRRRAQLQAGNTIAVTWTGRLEEQLGRFDVAEPLVERSADYLDSANALSAIAAMTAILRRVMTDNDTAASQLYPATIMVLDNLGTEEIWPALYVRWELGVLSALGFGLDLETCALSGATEGLTHVSPRSGRAVRADSAADYIDRLLVLPEFLLRPDASVAPSDVGTGLVLTGHFLEQRLFHSIHKPPPEARDRLVQRLERSGLAEIPD